MKAGRWLIIVALLTVTSSSLTRGETRSDSEQLDRFIGVWRPTAGATSVIEQAIQDTISPMNAVARPIARRRLMQKNVLPLRLRMERRGEVFVIQFSASEVFKLPLSGAPVKYGDSTMWLRLEADGIRHTGEAPEGRRQNFFRVGSDRDLMTMAVTMTSPRLPRPLQYTLEFTRVQ